MSYSIQWVRCLIFNIQMYVAMPIIGLFFLPWVLISPKGAYAGCHTYCRWVRWTAGWMINLKTEVRGPPPTGAVIVAAKHQSFLDILMIFGAIPRGKFIAKKILKYAPVLGQYGMRIGCVFVDRGKRSQAIKQMLAQVKADDDPGQLIIYPQGTRLAPGVKAPYKVGSAVLYEELGQPCVPVAINVGVLWPKRGVYRKPGTAIVEFLDEIPPGLPIEEFRAKLEHMVETRSDALMAEAGFKGAP